MNQTVVYYRYHVLSNFLYGFVARFLLQLVCVLALVDARVQCLCMRVNSISYSGFPHILESALKILKVFRLNRSIWPLQETTVVVVNYFIFC